jgi:hypothetical protein
MDSLWVIGADTAGADNATFARKILERKDLNTLAAKAKVVLTAINGDSVFEYRAVRKYRTAILSHVR